METVLDSPAKYVRWLNACQRLSSLKRKLAAESDPVARQHIEQAIIEADDLQKRLKARLS